MSNDFTFFLALIGIGYLYNKRVPPIGGEYKTFIDNPTQPILLQSKADTLIRNGAITSTKGNQSACIRIENSGNMGIEGGVYKTASYGIDIKDSKIIRLRDVDTVDLSVIGVKVNRCEDVLIDSPKSTDTADNAIDIGFNYGTVLINPYVRRCGAISVQSKNGIDTDSTTRAKIYDPDIDESPLANGIMVQRSNMVEIAGGNIRNCKVGMSIINNVTPIYVHDTVISHCPTSMWIGGGQKVWLNNVVTDKPISHANDAILHVNEGPPPNWF